MTFTTEQLQAYANNARNDFTTLEMQLASTVLDLELANRQTGAQLLKHSDEVNRLGDRCAELLSACQLAFTALDKLMGDSDLPNDNSDEMKACQALSAAIAKARGRKATRFTIGKEQNENH